MGNTKLQVYSDTRFPIGTEKKGKRRRNKKKTLSEAIIGVHAHMHTTTKYEIWGYRCCNGAHASTATLGPGPLHSAEFARISKAVC